MWCAVPNCLSLFEGVDVSMPGRNAAPSIAVAGQVRFERVNR